MNLWSILEIDPTDDVSIIKKAYAKKLKIHHPEEDPKGYQELRHAYDSALNHAKFMKKDYSNHIANKEISTLDLSPSSIKEDFCFHDTDNLPPLVKLSEVNVQAPLNLHEQNDKFMLQIEALYNDFFSRIGIDNWKILLNNDVMWNISNREKILNLVLDFLANHRYLPQEVWKLLAGNFQWCNEENPTYCHPNEEFIKYIQGQINQQNPLRYSFFNSGEIIDFESFLENREKAYNAFLENNLSAVNLYIERAKKIYQRDPDLLLIEGKLNLRNGNIDNAILIFSDLLLIEPGNLDALFYRGTAYFEKNQAQEAIKDYQQVYLEMPSNSEIPLILAKGYFKLGDLEKAKEWVLKAMDSNPFSSEAKSFRSQVNARIKSKLNNELKNDPNNAELKGRLDLIEDEILQKNNRNSNIKSNKNARFRRSLLKVTMAASIFILILFIFKHL